jgi:hypothetical protein
MAFNDMLQDIVTNFKISQNYKKNYFSGDSFLSTPCGLVTVEKNKNKIK